MSAVPIRTEAIGNPGQLANGRFAPGNKLGVGRPRGVDIRRVCEEHAAKNGIDLELAIWEIMRMQINLAKSGDAAATKLVLTMLCDVSKAETVGESLADVIASTISKNRGG